MAEESTRTTGNEPVEGMDPGGTHSTKPGKKSGAPSEKEPKSGETVQSGDQNANPSRF